MLESLIWVLFGKTCSAQSNFRQIKRTTNLLHILSFLYPVFKVLKPVPDFSSLTSLLGLSLTSFDVKLMVGSNGLEPSTSRLSGVRSNHLSYEPISVAFPVAIQPPVRGFALTG